MKRIREVFARGRCICFCLFSFLQLFSLAFCVARGFSQECFVWCWVVFVFRLISSNGISTPMVEACFMALAKIFMRYGGLF